jgi:hypothetical protein
MMHPRVVGSARSGDIRVSSRPRARFLSTPADAVLITYSNGAYEIHFSSTQTSPTFQPSSFVWTDLPIVTYDLGTDGVLEGIWMNDTFSCGATQTCGGGVFPFIQFTLQAPASPSVPEPCTLLLLGSGLAGLGSAAWRRRRRGRCRPPLR